LANGTGTHADSLIFFDGGETGNGSRPEPEHEKKEGEKLVPLPAVWHLKGAGIGFPQTSCKAESRYVAKVLLLRGTGRMPGLTPVRLCVSPNALWPPHHKLLPMNISMAVTDPLFGAVSRR
jgi:hypothetical protein